MSKLQLAIGICLLLLFLMIGIGWWRYSALFPEPSNEIVFLDNPKRDLLIGLRQEHKFEPHHYPPLDYTGVATEEDGIIARDAVNRVLNSVLSRSNGPVSAKFVSDQIAAGMKEVRGLETEDRDRTSDYMVEIWYFMGFKGATGRFAYGAAYPIPPGYGEPLPPGWKSPTEHRPFNLQ